MEFQDYLTEHIKRHPWVRPQDFIKLCYQAAFGAEHLLSDLSGAKKYFEEEFDAVEAQSGDLYEMISPDVCRINLAAWKAEGLPKEWLFRMFVHSASESKRDEKQFLMYLQEADRIVRKTQLFFSVGQWEQELGQYRAAGMPAVHHSKEFKEQENPAYRIVSSKYLRTLPVLKKMSLELSKVQEDKAFVLSMDGRAASGKTTMAELLGKVLEAGMIHMDDFFLPPSLRTEQRRKEPGGNVHYERFAEEVLPFLSKKEAFSYRIFDCKEMDYHGYRKIPESSIRIVEGSYSQHPFFGDYGDMKLFLQVEKEEQMRRICVRNGKEMAKIFQETWIPMEEEYFERFEIEKKADLVL